MSRILFAMAYPGYLRLYGAAVCALADRGHDVVLAYDKVKKTPGEQPLPEGAPAGLRVADPIPAHGGRFKQFLIDLGCSTDYVRFLANYGHLWIDDAAVAAGMDRNYSVDTFGLRAQIDF